MRQGFTVRRRQIVALPDPTYRFIKLLERLGLAWQLRIPSTRALLARSDQTNHAALAGIPRQCV